MLILSPRAVARLESYTPPWPLPKIFRLTKAGKLMEDIFTGATINTPSMLCVSDYLDALDWVVSIGGVPETIARSERNLAVLESWVSRRSDVHFLASEASQRSNTSVCLTLELSETQVKDMIKCWPVKRSPSMWVPIGMLLRACASGAAPRLRPRTWNYFCPGWIGLSPR